MVQSEPSGTPYHQFEEASPLFLKLGSATFTPGGWIDFTSIYRTTDVGSGFTTALATIPYNNTAAGALSENQLTAANSRLSLRVDEAISKVKVYGYGEIDFNGTAPGNVYVSTNSDVTRLRVFYLNLSAGKWDVLGGQSWSLLTPNRSGLSPFLSEIYNTVHLDTCVQRRYRLCTTGAAARGLSLHAEPRLRPLGRESGAVQRRGCYLPCCIQHRGDGPQLQLRLKHHTKPASGRHRQVRL